MNRRQLEKRKEARKKENTEERKKDSLTPNKSTKKTGYGRASYGKKPA